MIFKPGDIAWNYYSGKELPEGGRIKVKVIGYQSDRVVNYEVLEDFYGPGEYKVYQAGDKDSVSEIHMELIEPARNSEVVYNVTHRGLRIEEYDGEDAAKLSASIINGFLRAVGSSLELVKIEKVTVMREEVDI